MLLRNRSRAVTKPALMVDHGSQPPPNQNYARTIPSLFGSPKFGDFTNSGTDSLKSSTSILDNNRALSPFSFGFGNPFSYDNSNNTQKISKIDSKGIGLALVGALKDEPFHESKAYVLFGTQLGVKIPPLPPSTTFSPFSSQTSAAGDFGTKTKDSQNSEIYYNRDSVVTGVMSLSEMELSEEYTCVISHGLNPRTTHIFNNCIVEESYCSSLPQNSHYASGNFLSFCYTCKKHLEQTNDIFIYGGEKAFCSRECRHREMVLDGVENLEFESNGHS